MAQIYADENVPLPTVDELRRLGHDIVTMAEMGRANQAIADDQVLALATAAERALLTLNRRHFIRLHTEQPDHAGIIVCTFDADFVALAQRIHTALTAQQNIHGELLRVNRPQ